MIKQVLVPEEYNFIVTPKEIDELIENMSSTHTKALNVQDKIHIINI